MCHTQWSFVYKLVNDCPVITSFQWIFSLYFFFLVAKGLNMYQVLAPNAYSYVDAYVSSVNKNIHSLVYERVRN